MNFAKISRACPSKRINAWKVKIGSEIFLITPAHVAVYPREKKWAFSHFMNDYKQLDWRILYSYALNPSPFNDICWAKLSDDDGFDAINLLDTGIPEPTKVDIVYRQPYDWEGNWLDNKASLGATQGMLYQVPTTGEERVNDGLLECLDTGFRGMSGALAICGESTCVGMFVKRGSLIKFKDKSIIAEELVPTFVEQEPNIFIRTIRKSLGLDILSKKLDYLVEHTLTRNDMHAMAAVFDAGRGLFLPSTTILATQNQASIEVKKIIGEIAPDVLPY